MSDLSTEQELAACNSTAKVVVVAAAGSGKSRVLAARVNWLVKHGWSPGEIVAITFTNNAARVLQDRISHKIDYCGTLHGFLLRCIRAISPDVGMLSGEDAKALLLKIGKEHKCTKEDELIEYRQNWWKRPPTPSASDITNLDRAVGAYKRHLSSYNLIDFDEILSKGLMLIRQQQFPIPAHILVDEYQDTGEIDNAIYSLLAEQGCRFCAVGDPAQSIYGFRGGKVQNIIDMIEDDCFEVHYLNQNYRSANVIVQAAEHVAAMANCPERETKGLDIEGKIASHQFGGDIDQMIWIAEQVRQSDFDRPEADGMVPRPEIAILGRTNAIVAEVRNFLVREDLPVKGVRTNCMPADWRYTMRVIQMLAFPRNWAIAQLWMEEETCPIRIEQSVLVGLRRSTTPAVHLCFPEALTAWQSLNILDTFKVSPESILWIKEWLKIQPREMHIRDMALALLSGETAQVTGHGCFVGTVHAAKGMEFDHVILAGFEEGVWPMPGSPLDEELRILYVAMTRAKRQLDICWSSMRNKKFGQITKLVRTGASPLLEEIDETIT